MKRFLNFFVFLMISFVSFGQSQDKTKMEKERQSIQKELSEIQSTYDKVKGEKKQTIGQLSLIQKKVELQGQYVNNINKEIKILNDDIYLANLEVTRLKRQLDTLRTQYQRSVVYAYKNKSTYDYLNFIFSANTFNDALKRISYLKSYRVYRQQQVDNILETQRLIEEHKREVLNNKNQKSSALQNQTQQLTVLETQKKEKDAIVNKLKSQESDLKTQIAARKKRDAQLKNAIAAVIRREIEAAKREAAKRAEEERLARVAKEKADRAAKAAAAAAAAKSASNSNTAAAPATSKPATEKEEEAKETVAAAPAKKVENYLTLNEKDAKLAADFNSNRGRLPWPVDNGFVCIPYGTYQVPGTQIKGDNPGITICTPAPGSTVKSVFDGEISSVSNLGDGMTVMIRHGKYFTVYSNLGAATVSKGMMVKTGQAIGRSGTDDEGGAGGKIDFLLMVDTNNVNPAPWLRR